MKKILLVLFVLCVCLTGCSNGNNAKWDCVEYTSLDEMNSIAGTNILRVADSGISDEWFGIISNSIAQYKFEYDDEDWCIRGSKDVDNDISGLHYDNIGFEKDVTATYYNDEVYAFRFFFEGVQYVISLDVKDEDVSTSYFDKICNEFKTNVTGLKSGYETEIIENGDEIIYRITLYNDGEKVIMNTIYAFENDKMVSIFSENIFETEEAAKEYYDELIENGKSPDKLILEGTKISSNMNENLDFYSDYTKDEFVKMQKEAIGQ